MFAGKESVSRRKKLTRSKVHKFVDKSNRNYGHQVVSFVSEFISFLRFNRSKWRRKSEIANANFKWDNNVSSAWSTSNSHLSPNEICIFTNFWSSPKFKYFSNKLTSWSYWRPTSNGFNRYFYKFRKIVENGRLISWNLIQISNTNAKGKNKFT